MTLAVAVVDGDQAYLMSDLKLSYEVDRNPVAGIERPELGLKTFFLSAQLAIAYSGTVASAHRLIVDAWRLTSAGRIGEVLNHLASGCLACDDLEFLLMDVRGQPKAYKITRDEPAVRGNPVLWTGDADAAKIVLDSQSIKPLDLHKRFLAALDGKQVPSVGGLVPLARGTRGADKFVPTMQLSSPTYRPNHDNEWHPVDWGDAASGGYAYTTVTPVEAGRNGWGVHYFQGNFGYFFRVDLERDIGEKLRWRNTSLKSAIISLEHELGFPIEYGGELASRAE